MKSNLSIEVTPIDRYRIKVKIHIDGANVWPVYRGCTCAIALDCDFAETSRPPSEK